MRLPQFTAEVSLYRSAHSYGTSRLHRATGGELRIEPQQSYACDGKACVCHGASDCLTCALGGSCGGHCICDRHDTCLCDGQGPSLPL